MDLCVQLSMYCFVHLCLDVGANITLWTHTLMVFKFELIKFPFCDEFN